MASYTNILTLGQHSKHGFKAGWALLLNGNLDWSDSAPWMLVQEHKRHELDSLILFPFGQCEFHSFTESFDNLFVGCVLMENGNAFREFSNLRKRCYFAFAELMI